MELFKRLKIFRDIFYNNEDLILRDYLALERTRLANERTLLSYSRTSLYMLLGGIAFLQLQDFTEIMWIGYLAIGISVVLIVIGVLRYLQIEKRLKRYYEQKKQDDKE